jgi:flagellar biosynthesis protein FliR
MVSIEVSLAHLQLFFLVFLRTGAFLMSLPVLNAPSVPVLFRIGFGCAASLLLVPALSDAAPPVPADAFGLGVAAAGEILLGLLAGMSVRLVFEGVQLAGQIAGYQMGMAIAEVIDPASEDQVALLAQFNTLFATLIFLAINGHHAFIRCLVESYAIVPPLGFQVNGPVMERLIRLSAEIFVVGLKAGAPIIVALMLSTVSFGLVARTVPQMNIFIVAMPLKIGLGLLFLGLSLPHLAGFVGDLFGGAARSALALLRAVP